MDADQVHFEPFVHLAGLDDDQALIGWGGFWFTPFADGHGWRIIDDEQLGVVDAGRTESIGARSEPYGDALVEVLDDRGEVVTSSGTDARNHVWVEGLQPDTPYRYRITVDGRPWAAERLRRWVSLDGQRGELRDADRGYAMAFRTFPDPAEPADLRAVVLGDYGVGIQSSDSLGGQQQRIGDAITRLADHSRVDLVLTVGDNIYHRQDEAVGGSGSEDDDWYFSFYEPYRFVIDRLPLYPAVGNHDSAESEDSDDRAQMDDNHFLGMRFTAHVEEGRASADPGLFYRFSFGRDIELVCIDTSEAGDVDADRYFDSPTHTAFLDETFAERRTGAGRAHPDGWLIPFGHHPALCAGPKHHNDEDLLRAMVPRYRAAGVRLVLAGHEHNFQHAEHDGIHHLVTGAGGKLRDGEPDGFAAAHTRSWAAQPHFTLMEVTADAATLWPVADVDTGGRVRCIDAVTPAGRPADLPIVIPRTHR